MGGGSHYIKIKAARISIWLFCLHVLLTGPRQPPCPNCALLLLVEPVTQSVIGNLCCFLNHLRVEVAIIRFGVFSPGSMVKKILTSRDINFYVFQIQYPPKPFVIVIARQ
jgi:hypothetical protein